MSDDYQALDQENENSKDSKDSKNDDSKEFKSADAGDYLKKSTASAKSKKRLTKVDVFGDIEPLIKKDENLDT